MAVYFINNPDTDLIKIGMSTDIKARLKALTKRYGCQLELMGVMSGGAELEKELHARFSDIRESGEWFMSTLELEDFIRTKAVTLDELERTLEDVAFGDLARKFQNLIKDQRKLRGLTQEELAINVGVSRGYAQRLEYETKPMASKLIAVADYLGLINWDAQSDIQPAQKDSSGLKVFRVYAVDLSASLVINPHGNAIVAYTATEAARKYSAIIESQMTRTGEIQYITEYVDVLNDNYRSRAV